MSENSTQGSSPSRNRRFWPTAVVGTGIAGAATLTLVLLNPLGGGTAAASELTAFDNCADLQRHMAGLALDRILDRDRTRYSSGDGRPVPQIAPMPAAGAVVPNAALEEQDTGQALGFSTGTDAGSGAVAGTTAGAQPGDAPDAAVPAAGSAVGGSGESSAKSGAATAATTGGTARDAVGNNASGTNTQEGGVDEADLAKTDGTVLVTVVDGKLVVMDVSGDAPRARGSLDLPGQNPLELLLSGDRVVVVGTPTSFAKFRGDTRDVDIKRAATGMREVTTLTLVDLANPDRPKVVTSEEVSARYLSARMIGDTIRVVFSSTPSVLRTSDYTDYSRYDGERYYDSETGRYVEQGRDDYLADVRERLERVPAADWLPARRVVDRTARTVDEKPLLACEDVRYPVTDSGMDLISVLSIDAGNDDPLGLAAATAVIGSGDLVYASAERLYVATTDGGWDGDWRDPRAGGGTSTRVHSFDISGGRAEYLASGRVPGYLYGRWAMSEKDGLLRMVTTSNAPWTRGRTETGVVILDTRENRMREIGRVDGMGLTETVRSVRWFDDMAAIVTFRQTDPLYLVDVSKPESPRLRGELKIPGYSAYLHPIGDHRLLGIGQDADRFGGTRGLQLSTFDVLDMADPRRTDQLFLGNGTSSPVEGDARGFVYQPQDGLAVLPVYVPRDYSCRDVFVAKSRGESTADCATGNGVPAGLKFAADERGGSSSGLAAIRIDDKGDLELVASWGGTAGRDVIKVMPLPDGRLVSLDLGGITLLKADSLKAYGFASYR